MTTDFLTFLETHWNLIVNNRWVFIIYGVFVFLIGAIISWRLHNYLINVKLHNIPEREALLEQIAELKSENEGLIKIINRNEKEALINDMFHENKRESIGHLIAHKN